MVRGVGNEEEASVVGASRRCPNARPHGLEGEALVLLKASSAWHILVVRSFLEGYETRRECANGLLAHCMVLHAWSDR